MGRNDVRRVPAPPVAWGPHPGRVDLERGIRFQVGYIDPTTGPSSVGRHGMNLTFLLRGTKGVVQFLIYTNWMPDPDHILSEVLLERGYFDLAAPMGADVGYHARVAQYEEHSYVTQECEFLDGDRCYYDGSGLQANELLRRFVVDGDSAVWSELEDWYDSLKDASEVEE